MGQLDASDIGLLFGDLVSCPCHPSQEAKKVKIEILGLGGAIHVFGSCVGKIRGK